MVKIDIKLTRAEERKPSEVYVFIGNLFYHLEGTTNAYTTYQTQAVIEEIRKITRRLEGKIKANPGNIPNSLELTLEIPDTENN